MRGGYYTASEKDEEEHEDTVEGGVVRGERAKMVRERKRMARGGGEEEVRIGDGMGSRGVLLRSEASDGGRSASERASEQ